MSQTNKSAAKVKDESVAESIVDSAKNAQENDWLAVVSYIWILFVIPLILKREDEFVRHRAKQGLILFIFEILVVVVGSIPIIGWLIIMPLGTILAILLAVLGITHALKGEMWVMPLLGKYAQKVNL